MSPNISFVCTTSMNPIYHGKGCVFNTKKTYDLTFMYDVMPKK